MAARRPGFDTVYQLPQEIRRALEPVFDVVMRLAGMSTAKLKTLEMMNDSPLDSGTATLPETIERLNDVQVRLNGVIGKLNEVISRLQED